jgi:Flp pilus assembly protein TadD
MAAAPNAGASQASPTTTPHKQVKKQRTGGENVLLVALGVAALIVIGVLGIALTRESMPSWAQTETAVVGRTAIAQTQVALSNLRMARTLPPTWTPPPPTATGFVPTRAPDPTSTPRLRIVRTAIASRPTGVSSGDSLDLLKPEFLNKASAATLRPLILSDPTDPIPHYALAIVYYRNREEAKAEAELRRGLSLSKNDTTLLQKVAESVRAINTRGEASLTRLYVILEGQQYVLLPNNSAQKNIVGAALFALALEAERNEAAVNNLAAAAEFTNQAAVYALYALSEEKSGNGIQAEFTIRKAFGLDRDSPEVQLVRGIMADDTEEARSLLTSAANSPVRWVVEAAQRLLKGL